MLYFLFQQFPCRILRSFTTCKFDHFSLIFRFRTLNTLKIGQTKSKKSTKLGLLERAFRELRSGATCTTWKATHFKLFNFKHDKKFNLNSRYGQAIPSSGTDNYNLVDALESRILYPWYIWLMWKYYGSWMLDWLHMNRHIWSWWKAASALCSDGQSCTPDSSFVRARS